MRAAVVPRMTATGIQFLFLLSFAGKSQIFDWSSTMFGIIRPSDTGRWYGGTGCGAGVDWLASESGGFTCAVSTDDADSPMKGKTVFIGTRRFESRSALRS